jgi:hypothetical protein
MQEFKVHEIKVGVSETARSLLSLEIDGCEGMVTYSRSTPLEQPKRVQLRKVEMPKMFEVERNVLLERYRCHFFLDVQTDDPGKYGVSITPTVVLAGYLEKFESYKREQLGHWLGWFRIFYEGENATIDDIVEGIVKQIEELTESQGRVAKCCIEAKARRLKCFVLSFYSIFLLLGQLSFCPLLILVCSAEDFMVFPSADTLYPWIR